MIPIVFIMVWYYTITKSSVIWLALPPFCHCARTENSYTWVHSINHCHLDANQPQTVVSFPDPFQKNREGLRSQTPFGKNEKGYPARFFRKGSGNETTFSIFLKGVWERDYPLGWEFSETPHKTVATSVHQFRHWDCTANGWELRGLNLQFNIHAA